ncbi:MAG: tyrosine--tRNA ligase [Treponema succinifaciens]|uniref:tyrosine--tRNA ligase n=1 Tax=Treponema TaxID=157 RepID=UPI002352519F|nr:MULTISPECIES: tyrosine--tRNA ligase [Treponema]MCI6912787.1 tyrosine--tRNA ligase [Treponema succinifaciens]MDD6962596.1 tyrosine--tRNA ligase [Treponema succinifaciens]MDY5116795.1 tyrosine--tRNA ligase [Treponema succinifaciens]UKI54790.1 MAG: tyrosine--tRNA ligase [Treponema succinifaciens]
MTFFEELQWRGLVKDVAGEDIADKLNNEKITFYWGTDPTADSLHLGHYSSLVTAKRLARAGHHPILLVGGSTGLIGDPRPTAEREIISHETLEKNLAGIKSQVDRIFEGKAEIVNNYDWTKDYTFLEFLRDIGKYINVNYMLSKEIISRRLDTGITFAEFSYTLLQGYDFLWLYRNKNCILQAEGADQWGNITTGLELIRKIEGKEAYGFTMPLVLDKYGNKFGKSAGNALWLDLNKTSSYELYQYLVNVDDSMVVDYLKIFTFLSKDQIEELEAKNKEKPELREAHKALAREIITDLHGAAEFEKAVNISNSLFSGNVKSLSLKDIEIGFKDVPTATISEGEKLIDVLVNNKIASSKREAREFLAAGSITLNGEKFMDENMPVTRQLAIEGKVIVLRRGKKKNYIVKFG